MKRLRLILGDPQLSWSPLKSEDPVWFEHSRDKAPPWVDCSKQDNRCDFDNFVEAMGLEPTNLLTASQALYQLSYAPSGEGRR